MSTTTFKQRLDAGLSEYPKWIKITKTYSDFATASLTNDISIYTLSSLGIVHAVVLNPTTAFSGGVISAVTLSVGITGSLATYLVANTIFTGSVIVSGSPAIQNSFTATDVRASIISVGVAQTLNNLTAGSVDIYLLVSTLP